MNTCKENNLQKNLDEAIANAANACKVICAINTRFAQHGFPMLVIGESHSIMGENGNRTLCIDRDDLALLNAISIRETLKIADFVGKIKKNLDEAIANAANASKAICAINSHFAQHGIPMLVMSDVHKLMGEKGKKYLGINSDDLALLNAISMHEAVQIAELAVKIKQRGNYPYPPINVILNGDTRRGMYWANLLDELLGLHLKSLPFSKLYSGKHYEGKGLFIIASDLPVAELKRGFPKLYSDVILLKETPSGV